MTLLIALDGKPHSQQIVDLVQQTFDLSEQQIIILHVLTEEDTEIDQPDNARQEIRTLAIREAGKLLELLSEPFRNAGAEVSTFAEYGPIPILIKARAEAKQANVIVCAPAKHSAKDLLFKGSLTRDLMRFNWQGTLICARKSSKKEGQIVFLLDGTKESFDSLQLNVSMLNQELPLLIIASRLGFETEANRSWFGRSAPAITFRPEESMKQATEILAKLNRKHTSKIIDQSFEQWLTDTENQEPSLLFLSRTVSDTTHQAITYSPAEALFLNASCSTALSCFKSESFHSRGRQTK